MAGGGVAAPAAVKLWDLPVRLVHWAFVLLLPLLWWSAEEGDLDLHKKLGMALLILLVFRLLWGLFGSSTARFAGFVRGPATVGRYVRGLFGKQAEPVVGHNPLGGWSVVIMLALLALQLGLGLIAQDTDGIESGPLNHLVSYDTADWARETHELMFNVLVAVIVLHLAAIGYYLIAKRDNLVGPMITGTKRYPAGAAAPAMAPAWRALACGAAALACGWWIWIGAPLP